MIRLSKNLFRAGGQDFSTLYTFFSALYVFYHTGNILFVFIIRNLELLETLKFFPVSLLFFFFTYFWIFFSIWAFSAFFLCPYDMKLFFFFCLWLPIITCKFLHLLAEWMILLCRIQYFLLGLQSAEDSLLDSTTLELE